MDKEDKEFLDAALAGLDPRAQELLRERDEVQRGHSIHYAAVAIMARNFSHGLGPNARRLFTA